VISSLYIMQLPLLFLASSLFWKLPVCSNAIVISQGRADCFFVESQLAGAINFWSNQESVLASWSIIASVCWILVRTVLQNIISGQQDSNEPSLPADLTSWEWPNECPVWRVNWIWNFSELPDYIF
jgi:hypothetical protein